MGKLIRFYGLKKNLFIINYLSELFNKQCKFRNKPGTGPFSREIQAKKQAHMGPVFIR